jgi:hypothetical protein
MRLAEKLDRSTHLSRFGNFAALSVSMRSKAEGIWVRLMDVKALDAA